AKAQRMMRTAVRAAKVGRKCSYVLVADDRAQIVGVLNAAEWPNCQLSMSEKLKTAPVMVRVAGWALPRSLKMVNVWAKHGPHERHWHVAQIGVHRRRQACGVGKALLSSFLTTIDEQRAPAYLETDVDRNVLLYEQFGFRVVAQAEINGVHNRFMWRRAATES